LDVAAVQAALRADGLDGWLLYDFRGLNPIAADITGVHRQGGHLATRRWYYLIPTTGEPRALVHRIEKDSLAHLPGSSERYAGRDQLEAEYDIQQLMAGWFRDEGLVADSDPNVSAQENAGNPHYLPTKTSNRQIRTNEILLLDLWGKLDKPGAVYADIPERFVKAFATICAARDAGIALVQQAARSGRELRGWEVDRAASTVIKDAGFGAQILHRTGHSLGETVHGNGVNMDDYETHDDRRLLPGTGFTIEPGVYFDDFGVRTEINMVVAARDAAVTGPLQTEITKL
jgi:Xaa-Pro dipeptidase